MQVNICLSENILTREFCRLQNERIISKENERGII